ncbi:opacity protein-like surface antigen [Rubricella aquisinus]|uniref:Opacity protein-like surface antigen n=1 Tax=Rubricella aquisinus TaxID=2028108 RepID=A0A840WXZ0_9RHOB|nr:YjbH domain-containing protein [Rubricella aquisinus]MBB5514535.1 opacity protein-like surface antigen [Rubricella aquisinus]
MAPHPDPVGKAQLWHLVRRAAVVALLTASCSSAALAAEQPFLPTLGTYGTTGLIDMPTAQTQPDGELTTTFSNFAGETRSTLTFQITPRLSGSFRYTIIENYQNPTATAGSTNYDRSFDIAYQIIDNSRYLPDVAIGLRDFIGTGLYSSEYIVATQQVGPRLAISGGIGWGRLGSYQSFTNPFSVISDRFNTRPGRSITNRGGTANFNQWFRGPAAAFGGLSYAVNDKLTLKAEYSSDAYPRMAAIRNSFNRRHPINLGAHYRIDDEISLAASYLHGDAVSLQASFALNPLRSFQGGSIDPAPAPVTQRADPEATPASWTSRWMASPDEIAQIKEDVKRRLEADEQVFESLSLVEDRAVLYFRNEKYDIESQAIGRAARILADVLPPSVERFVIVPVIKGMPTIAAAMDRSDIETLEYDPDGTERLLANTMFGSPLSFADEAPNETEIYPLTEWSLSPSFSASLFDPDTPFRAGLSARLAGSVEVSDGLILSGAAIKSIAGNLGTVTRTTTSALPAVRSDFAQYQNQGDPAILRLTLDKFDRPFTDIYTRATVGYLERMYGGVSGEVLWKQPDNPLALGFELNYVQQRDFDGMFGFQSYDVVTGHASAYYDFGNGFEGQVDAGQYLAGDVGATFALKRTFRNGWEVGAFFTLTDVPFADFGEGSFDKGLTFRVPLGWMAGRSTRTEANFDLRPLTRDGGARLSVNNRLYDMVKDYQTDPISDTWGRFWR